MRDIVAPVELPSGELKTDGVIRLDELAQWYGLRGKCICGKTSEIDRYHPKVWKWQGYPIAHLATKLICTSCVAAGRGRREIKVEPFKLPRGHLCLASPSHQA